MKEMNKGHSDILTFVPTAVSASFLTACLILVLVALPMPPAVAATGTPVTGTQSWIPIGDGTPPATLTMEEALDTSCKLGWLPESMVDPFNDFGISESVLLVGAGAMTVGLGSLMLAGIDLATAGMATAVGVGLWLLHLPLEIAIFGTGGIAAWEAYKWFVGDQGGDQGEAEVPVEVPVETPAAAGLDGASATAVQ